LEEQKRGLVAILGESRGNEIDGGRRNVGNVFGAQDDIVVRWEVFFTQIGNGVADLIMLTFIMATTDYNLPTLGFQPSKTPWSQLSIL
jgi:hypothetical protein